MSFKVSFDMCFNLDHSETLSSGNGLNNCVPNIVTFVEDRMAGMMRLWLKGLKILRIKRNVISNFNFSLNVLRSLHLHGSLTLTYPIKIA